MVARRTAAIILELERLRRGTLVKLMNGNFTLRYPIPRVRRHGVLIVCMALYFGQVCASNLKDNLDTYFSDLKEQFDHIAAGPAIRSTKLSNVDRYFVGVLRKNQTFHTLLRTNSKGMVINEVIRGQKPARDVRDVSKQEWYQQIARRRAEYQSVLREDNGRYYLFWSAPYMFGSGSDRFGGAVVVKIDLWDCFHKFSADITIPFLARLGNRSLYSHKWKEEISYREERLSVPGVDRISLRYPQSEPEIAETLRLETSLPAAPSPGAGEPPAAALVNQQQSSTLLHRIGSLSGGRLAAVLAVAGAFVLTLLFLLFQLVSHLRNFLLMRRIERDDRL